MDKWLVLEHRFIPQKYWADNVQKYWLKKALEKKPAHPHCYGHIALEWHYYGKK